MLTWCCFCCQGHENERAYIATQGKLCGWSTVSSVRSKMVSTCSGKPIITLSTSLPFIQRVHCWPDWQLSYFVLSLQSVDLCLFLRLSPLGRRWHDGLGFVTSCNVSMCSIRWMICRNGAKIFEPRFASFVVLVAIFFFFYKHYFINFCLTECPWRIFFNVV